MAFENLSAKLQDTMKKLRGQTRVTEKDVKEFMREIRMALLEADVNYKVAKDFVASVSEKAVGQAVLESLTPGQQIVKIVYDELTELLGSKEAKLDFSRTAPHVIMMVGLQGAGKTTGTGKLALHLRKDGKKPLMVACDVYRPAAVKQLQVLGGQMDIPVFAGEPGQDPVRIAKDAKDKALRNLNDVVIVDTAGRLQINEELMDELVRIKEAVKPSEILLVVDAMTGQEAANVAQSFNEKLDITGVILSKLDSDTRGGSALSVRAITGKPVKFASSGEKMSDLEVFHPDRMANRILGMGDVLSLIDKAQEVFDEKEAIELEKKIRSQTFTLDDYMQQMRQMKKLGGLGKIMKMLPGVAGQITDEDVDKGEVKLKRTEAIICSMTMKERNKPEILNASRRKRIAAGSGTTVQEINTLIREFDQVKAMMKQFTGKKGGKMGKMKLPF